MPDLYDTTLAPWTTLGLGGPARRLVAADTEQELLAAVSAADSDGSPLLVLGHGSNVVVGDEGHPGTAVLVRCRGVVHTERAGAVHLTLAAGEPLDATVRAAVRDGLSGLECLTGVPGTVGAAPVQNVGAYGQELEEVVVGLRAYDREERGIVRMSRSECRFGHRDSVFKRTARWVVLDVTVALRREALSRPVVYPELAAELGVPLGSRVPLRRVPSAVLAVRRRKGMVLDAADPDSRSVGSFFVSPVVSEVGLVAVTERAGAEPPNWHTPNGLLKLNAAWLIERAGFPRGYGGASTSISRKHAHALTHCGGGTTAELLALARRIRDGVLDCTGVELVPEPLLVNCMWEGRSAGAT